MQHDPNTPEAAPAGTVGQGQSAAAEAAAPPAGDHAQPSAPETSAETRLATEVETLKGQIADLTDRLLRAHADMDNMRKRAERERTDTARYAITRFAQDIVAVADNFERAVAAVPKGAEADDPALKALVEGVTMTEREFLKALDKHGVRRISPQGEPFNPHVHQAVMEMQNAEVAAGTVLQVFQAGYMIEERVLRPAMVAVAKGGFKPVKPAGAAEGAAPEAPTAGQAEAAKPANDDVPPAGAAEGTTG